MSAKEQVIKFSPFEALLIGEKNNILKRQPMKNTRFVTKLNRRRKSINLRDLFGLENNTKTENSEIVFKMPQRVCDFLKHRKLQNKSNDLIKGGKDEILYYKFERCKMIAKNNKNLMSEDKTLIVKLNRIKFEENNFQKFKYKNNLRHKVVKKFPSPTRKRNECNCNKSWGLKNNSKNFDFKRHSLRGKDGKFICKADYQKLKSGEITPKRKYMSNYIHRLYLKKNKQIFNKTHLKRNGNSRDLELPYSLETTVGWPNLSFDITASELILNELSKKYYENSCHEDFKFPEFPKLLEPLDFESDSCLLDILYENFPRIVKFESAVQENDFSSALFNADILKAEKKVKMYEKKKNGFVKENGRVLMNHMPIIKLRRINEIMPNLYPIKNEKTMFQSQIDEPYTEKSHLLQGKSFGSFFFQSAEGKDIFIGNLLKSFLPNSWFGSLPES